jgi:ZIP family zinc transporter
MELDMEKVETLTAQRRLPTWLLALLPLLVLVGLVGLFLVLNPLSPFTGAFPPLEELSVQQIVLPAEGQIELTVINGGPDPVTIAQVLVDDAYWQFTIEPDNTLARLEEAKINLAYPWVRDEPLAIRLITSTGITFDEEVEVAIVTPAVESQTFVNYGLIGVLVGIVPVALGMLWYPFLKSIERKWMSFILALTVGLLIFLLVDTLLEALEIAASLPGVFQGVPIIIFCTMLSFGGLLAIGWRNRDQRTPLAVATMIALGIGLHNFGEGLAIGAAFATGAAALGSFLVIGFMLHNITEGVGIVAPLLRGTTPHLRTFVWLVLLAGAPAVLGTWVGGLAFSPLLATVFLSLGAGAILQVIWEVGKLLGNEARRQDQQSLNWLNLVGLFAGILVMYLTAFLVKF